MGVSFKDDNFVSTFTAVLNTDGVTIIGIKVGLTTHGIKAKDAATGSDKGPINALRDANNVPTLLAVSSSDGKTVVPVYADSSGNLLITST